MVLIMPPFSQLEFYAFSIGGKYCVFKSLVLKVERTRRINAYY